MTTNTDIAVLNSEAASHFLQVAQETQSSEFGRLLKFVKGHYVIGDDEVPVGGKYVAHLTKLVRGYVKFAGGQLIEQRMGKVADGFKLPTRESLGDTDESKWERDASGNPRDPWARQYYLPLEDCETGEVMVFVTSSRGGCGAIGALCSTFAKNTKNGLPVIRLGTSSYKHRSYGRVDVPDFAVVNWTKAGADTGGVDDDNAIVQEVLSPSEDMDDACPF